MWHDLEHELTQAEAINAAHIQVMKENRSTITVGEGVRDPRGLYGTTQGLLEKFGSERVVNMPVSESAVMGVCTGAAMLGIRPIVVFQNMEYALLAINQLVTHTVRFSLLNKSLPIVIRILIGQNWLNGPQNFQGLHTLLAQIDGLKVIMPVSAKDAKGMMIQAVDDNGPVVILEHCWLYSYKGLVPAERYTLPLEKASIVRSGVHITVAAFSFSVLQAVRAANVLTLQGIEIEVIDMRSARPLDIKTVLASIRRTGRLIVVDSGIIDNAIAAELITQICELGFDLLAKAPVRISSVRQPVPFEATPRDEVYVENDSMEIATASLELINRNNKVSHERLAEALYYDQRLDPNVIRI